MGFMKDVENRNPFVTPAQAGVQKSQESLDSRLRGNDSKEGKNWFEATCQRRFSQIGCHLDRRKRSIECSERQDFSPSCEAGSK
jgi:hypothetical protein